ncbi:phosphoribosylaminoimidazole carboxylase, ATPase subunit [Parascardovia denticolens DSM 10105 = JCM 12538]|uniref:N5-carboxyaminoimidazole ribonucleotide synthase n=1 Tax=Parascardovia denticolens DSM 10105 = JCM 12538 TaxID=864564 RepID=E6JZJ5_PARDN|nr:5-(carboxyamino)imidazole ribonucleotide synthase [Parascardovia denticolens]EFG33590.1 phosphoribosylaminoimidazole carboxylase, ATPase subunit [Parascardovia denticolens F0305]EFT84041.1 phosphoribosylaminoimidazole carboxylase, ATPase subunit [Parascardovia denticolens DSM 10105 = JCM 12538]BAR05121.1 phosphoribosylaminoimidazole carboxylase ATPase subunit [Parascardovia denticolens DSM 10105 = JCM 12538]
MPSLSEITEGRILSLGRGATVGIVGGGQLGRMMAISARYMGLKVGVLDPTDDCPTGQVADFQIVADYDDQEAIRQLAQRCDVLTYEFENVDADALDQVSDLVAIPQGTDLLRVTQHRIHEKTFINQHGIETAPWKQVDSRFDLEAALSEIGYPAVLKTATGGYDGHGQLVIKSEDDLEQLDKLQPWAGHRTSADGFPPCVLEGFVDFDFEASILVSGNGRDYVTFPLVRNDHRNNILHMTIAPAQVPETVADEAWKLALTLAEGFRLAGTLAIELFVTKNGRVLVNELAPRPHNSGHYTIEACSISQYDAHIRGIIGWDLEQPRLLSPAVMVNILGQHVAATQKLAPSHPEWNVHDYGKAQIKTNRKMGHITVLTEDTGRTVQELEATGCWDDLD